jgi:membrane-associated phospholipid phosphatase
MAAWERAILEARSWPFFDADAGEALSSLERMLETPRRLWMAAAACVAAFLALLAVVYTTEPGAAADERALHGFGELQRPRLAELADGIANLADPKPFALIGLVLVVIAFVRGYPLVGIAAGVVLVGANVTSQVLKPLLATPRGAFGEFDVAAEAFPSGHATAAMSLALAAVMVAPSRFRPVVGFVGAGFALAVGFAIMSLDWHFPSDVAGGYLVAATWCFAALAVLRTGRLKAALPEREEPYAWWPAVVAMLVPLLVVGWLALERLPRVTGYAEGHTTFAAVAAATAVLVAVLVGAVLTVHDRH